MLTLLAALLHTRLREITDTLVDLFISTVHRIRARADKKVTAELVNAFKRVTGKENILFAIAEASLGRPDDPVRRVVYPAVAGGEQTLRELVHEFKTKGPVYRRTVQTTLKASYSNHYRRGLIELLDVLEFRSSNATHRPVLASPESLVVPEHLASPVDLPDFRRMLPTTAGRPVPANQPADGSCEGRRAPRARPSATIRVRSAPSAAACRTDWSNASRLRNVATCRCRTGA